MAFNKPNGRPKRGCIHFVVHIACAIMQCHCTFIDSCYTVSAGANPGWAKFFLFVDFLFWAYKIRSKSIKKNKF